MGSFHAFILKKNNEVYIFHKNAINKDIFHSRIERHNSSNIDFFLGHPNAELRL